MIRRSPLLLLVLLLAGTVWSTTLAEEAPQSPRETITEMRNLLGKGEQASDSFKAGLKHSDARVRAAAVQFLGLEIGEKAVPLVAPMVADPAENVAVASVGILLDYTGPTVEKAVRAALADSRDRVVAQSVAYLGERRDTRFMDEIGGLVSHENVALRRTAIEAFQAFGDRSAAPYLLAATGDSEINVVLSALRGLTQLGGPEAIPRVRLLLDRPEHALRAEAYRTLVALGWAEAVDDEGRSLLAERLAKDAEPTVRIAAASALKDRPAEANLPALKLLADDGDATVRHRAVSALVAQPGNVASAIVRGLAHDPDDNTRISAVRAIGQRSDAEGSEVVLAAAADPIAGVRTAAAFSLGALGGPSSLDALSKLAKDEQDQVRRQAALSVGQIGDERGLKILEKLLGDTSVFVRAAATQALGDFSGARAFKLLTKRIGDEDLTVKLAAIQALARSPHPQAQPTLQAQLKHPTEAVRQAARRALEARP